MSTNSVTRLIGLLGVGFAAALGSYCPQCASAAAGDLYATDSTAGQVLRFARDGTSTVFANGLSEPEALTFDRSGNLYVVENGTGSILKFTPAGDKSVFASGFTNPAGVAFDAHCNLYASDICPFDRGCGDIFRYDANGTQADFFHGVNFATLAFDQFGNLFAGEGGPVQTGKIDRFMSDATQTTFTMSAGAPAAIAFDTVGNLFVADPLSGRIYKFASAGGQSVFTEEVNGPIALAFDGTGTLYVGNEGNDSITAFSSAATKIIFATGIHPGGLALEPVLEKLRNMSARGVVGTGDNVLIEGFILGGNPLATNAIVVRGIGPSLVSFGVTDALQDPILELHDTDGLLIATNDDWQEGEDSELLSLGLAPTDPRESALYVTLPSGNYTAVLRGSGDTTGVTLVELYGLQ